MSRGIAFLGLWLWLCLSSLAHAQSVSVSFTPPPPKPPEASLTDIRDFRSAGLFIAGAVTGFFAHEGGHVFANLLQGNVPHFQSVKGFGFIPFFTVAPRIYCDPHDHCYKANGSRFRTGVPGKVGITSAGFNVQHITDEILLSHNPRLRYKVAPYQKGLLAFNTLLSVGYAFSAMTRIENKEGDVTKTAELIGMPREVYAGTLLLIAGLDIYRYMVPSSRWAPWVSRGSKTVFLGVLFFL